MLVAPLESVALVWWHMFACALATFWVLAVVTLFAFVCPCGRCASECWWHRGCMHVGIAVEAQLSTGDTVGACSVLAIMRSLSHALRFHRLAHAYVVRRGAQ